VVVQELKRYNHLTRHTKRILSSVFDALEGVNAMSDELEQILNMLYDNKLPDQIKKISYLCNKPLASWVDDLCARLKFLYDWVENGTPKMFWMGAFFYTESFLTGVLQNYSRKMKIPIDKLSFNFRAIAWYERGKYGVGMRKPEVGVFVYGLYLEGAR
jgi:dynein heavy chain